MTSFRVRMPLWGDAILGWDLDDVLEGPDVVPLVEPPDRREQVVVLPALSPKERELEYERLVSEYRAEFGARASVDYSARTKWPDEEGA